MDALFLRVNSSEPSSGLCGDDLSALKDPLNCLSACVSSIDLHCVSPPLGAFADFFPQRPVSGQSKASQQLPFPILSTLQESRREKKHDQRKTDK